MPDLDWMLQLKTGHQWGTAVYIQNKMSTKVSNIVFMLTSWKHGPGNYLPSMSEVNTRSWVWWIMPVVPAT
jgi:hypothetical protein